MATTDPCPSARKALGTPRTSHRRSWSAHPYIHRCRPQRGSRRTRGHRSRGSPGPRICRSEDFPNFMDYERVMYGLYMVYIWVIYGLYMGYIWVIYGYIWVISHNGDLLGNIGLILGYVLGLSTFQVPRDSGDHGSSNMVMAGKFCISRWFFH